MPDVPGRLLQRGLPAAIFVLGTGVGLGLWNRIRLPYRNSWDVVGPHSLLQSSPVDDLVRFACLILAPIALLAIVCVAGPRFFRRTDKAIAREASAGSGTTEPTSFSKATVLLLALAVAGAIAIPIDVAEGRLDTFHEGESLGPAALMQNGATPYEDFVIPHGLFQDPHRSLLAFRLFGESIAATRTLQSMVKIASFAMLALLLLVLFRNQAEKATWVMIVFLLLNLVPAPFAGGARSQPWVYPAIRDIVTFGSLVALLAAHRWGRGNPARSIRAPIAFLAAALLPTAAFAFSADRGFYALSAYLILAPLLYVARIRRGHLRTQFLIATVLGLAGGCMVTAFLARGAFVDLLKFTFHAQPSYWGYLTGRPYSPGEIPFAIPLVLAAANAFVVALMLVRRLCENEGARTAAVRTFLDSHFPDVALLISSLLLFHTALGRSDAYHVGIGAGLTYLLSAVLVARRVKTAPAAGRRRSYVTYAAAAGLILYLGTTIVVRDRLQSNFPLGTPDADIVPEGYRDAAAYLRDNLADGELFYSLTSEGIWFYLTGKPCPTRFPALYYAAPARYQEEVVRDLGSSNVKFVIVANGSFATSIDGINVGTRFPQVVDFVSQNYRPHTRIADHEIWIRR